MLGILEYWMVGLRNRNAANRACERRGLKCEILLRNTVAEWMLSANSNTIYRRVLLSRAHTSAKAKQTHFITIIQEWGKKTYPMLRGMTRAPPDRNTVLPGTTWNVNRNPNLSQTLTNVT